MSLIWHCLLQFTFAKMSNTFKDNTHDPILQQLKKALSHIPESTLREFSLSIFPCHTSNDVYQNILNNISFKIEISNTRTTKHTIAKQIIQKSTVFGSTLEDSLTRLLSNDFLERVKAKSNIICLDSSKQNVSKNEKRKKTKEVDIQHTKKKAERLDQNSQSYSKGRPTSKVRSSSADKIDIVNNIEEGDCNCDQLTNNESDTLECCHCSGLIQLEFTNKSEKGQKMECLFCHLKQIVPNRPVHKQLFTGILKKGRRKHEINFEIDQQNLQSCRNMQIRCFRLNDTTRNFILFPDLCQIQINGILIKQFVPLHKQSSLKYRKDEPITVNFMQLSNNMKVVVTEEEKDKIGSKNDRVQSEDHLIAFYIINELTCNQLCREIESTCLTSFQESLNLLNILLKGHSNIQEVSLEMIKIPLLCALSTERIKVPVRGIFCKHFQCFDLRNYVYMIAQSANPRWLCPLCRLPAYQLKVDCIIYAILNEHSQVNKLSEVLFFGNGEYSISNKPTQKIRYSIYQLNFQSLRKRRHDQDDNKGVVCRGKEKVIDLVS